VALTKGTVNNLLLYIKVRHARVLENRKFNLPSGFYSHARERVIVVVWLSVCVQQSSKVTAL